MTSAPSAAPGCPVHDNIDTRKSAEIARRYTKADDDAHWVKDPAVARKVARNKTATQAGASADQLKYKNPEQMPVFFLDGEMHANKRRSSLRFLSPKAVSDKHFALMRRVSDELIAGFRSKGRTKLEDISFALAAEVVGEILGLTESAQSGRIRRTLWVLSASISQAKDTPLSRFWLNFKRAIFTGVFYYFDVRPAIKARQKDRRDDAISTYLDEGYTNMAIMVECLTYGTAGMLTTREFIVMVAWYFFDNDDLRQRFLGADQKEQLAILLEILRLEPIAAMIHRRVQEPVEGLTDDPLPPGEKYGIDIRAINVDESFVGECPFAFDPERAKKVGDSGKFVSFGDGPHSCPGWLVALHETRIFLEQLFRVPGLRLEREPDISWNAQVQGYELRNAIIVCDDNS